MAEAQDKKPTLFTPKARLGQYPNIFTLGKPNDAGKAYYEMDLLIDPEAQKSLEFQALKAAAAAAVKEEWGSDVPEGMRSPFRKASSKKRQSDNSSYYPEAEFPGHILLHVKSKNQPGVVGNTVDPKTGKVRIITDDVEVYGGCFIRASVHPFAYQVKGNSGVSFWVNNIQKLADGPALGGYKSAPTDDFGPVAGATDEELDDMFGDAA
jgi:hypothetical protein